MTIIRLGVGLQHLQTLRHDLK